MALTVTFDKSKHKIGIIAPASSPLKDARDKLNQAIFLLNEKGFQVKCNEILAPAELPYFAAPKELRLKSFKDVLLDPEILIIWAFRGGYGCTEFIFDCLNFKPTTPKTLIGFSDITAMLLLFTERYKLPAIHGSVLTSLLDKQQDMVDFLIAALSGENTEIKLQSIYNNKSLINGPVIGGNLTLICQMIGTKLMPNFQNKIIFVEEVNDKGYQVHRNLIHMKNAGLYDGVKAIIFGDFNAGDEYIEQSINSFCKSHIPHIPSFRAQGIGHEKINYPIVLNEYASIKDNILTVPSPFRLS